MLRATCKADTGRAGLKGFQVAAPFRPGETGPVGDDDLERRRRELEASLASRKPAGDDGGEGSKAGGTQGYGQALRLSSEFIAGIGVGAGLGWLIDRAAGTSPWGLIVFLLLGFVAGVLNVMRSAGLVAENRPGAPKGSADSETKK